MLVEKVEEVDAKDLVGLEGRSLWPTGSYYLLLVEEKRLPLLLVTFAEGRWEGRGSAVVT